MGTSGNKDIENKDNTQEENVSQWAELITQVVDKITGKDVSITYRFDNLELMFPRQLVLMAKSGKRQVEHKW